MQGNYCETLVVIYRN